MAVRVGTRVGRGSYASEPLPGWALAVVALLAVFVIAGVLGWYALRLVWLLLTLLWRHALVPLWRWL